jgi:two-component system, cell cycle response regulator DivK
VISVLLVEDHPLVSKMMMERLRRQGFTVTLAEDGVAALAAAEREQPDVILMDLGLPVLDGHAASARLKAGAATRDIPIIALTAQVHSGGADGTAAPPWDDFEAKPADFGRLVGKIRFYAARRGASGDPPDSPTR